MSVPVFERRGDAGVAYAVHLVEEVAPRLLSPGTPLTQRAALAYAYYKLLRLVEPGACSHYCEGISEDYKRWGTREIERVAEAVVHHASRILKRHLYGEGAPKPPSPFEGLP